MSAASLPVSDCATTRPLWSLDAARLQRGVLWTFVACGATVSIEPSPYEFMFVVAALTLGFNGLVFHRAMIPMIVLLAALNAGGLLSLVPFVESSDSNFFIAISVYIAVTAVFFAAVVAKDPSGRMATIRSGYIATGFIAAALGILGYFDVAGLGEYFTRYDNLRAAGPFKDPNVFGPFLVLPIVFLMQDLLLRRRAGLWRRLLLLGTMIFGLLLSLSRGAWGDCVISAGLLVAFTFLTTTSPALRQRIVLLSALGIFLVALALAVALSIPSVGAAFGERASFNQEYDLGELGRFGAQLRSIPLLLERPFGFGPMRYNLIFPQAPHEVYVNAFSAYGWLGGLSFVTFTAVTVYIGFRLVFERSKFQIEAIAIWSCLLPQMAQGFQIDTDHWRHLFLMFGCLYGLAAATRMESDSRQRSKNQREVAIAGADAIRP